MACKRTPLSFQKIQEQTQRNVQAEKKRKTLQLLLTSPPQPNHTTTLTQRSPSPDQQSQQMAADQEPLLEIARTLVKLKNLHSV